MLRLTYTRQQQRGDTPNPASAPLPQPTGSQGPVAEAERKVEATGQALGVYGMAFEEVKRQVAVECKERAVILDALWSHALTLVEMRSEYRHEVEHQSTQQTINTCQRELQEALDQVQMAYQQVDKAHDNTTNEHLHVQHQCRVVTQKLVRTQKELTQELEGHAKTKSDLQEALSAKADLQARVKVLTKETADAKRASMDAKIQAATADKAASQQKAQVAQLRGQLADQRQENKQLQQQARDALVRQQQTQAEYERLQTDYRANEVLLAGTKNQLEDCRAKVETLQFALEDTRDELEVSQQGNTTKGAMIVERDATISQVRSDMRKLSLLLQDEQEAHSSAKLEIEELKANEAQRQKNVLAQLKQTQEKVTKLEGHLKHAQQEILEKGTYVKSLLEDLNEKQGMLEVHHESLRVLAQVLEPLKVGNLMSILTDPTADQDAHIRALEANVEAARNMIDTASSTIQRTSVGV